MNTWLYRLRVTLILSPALFLLHVWILACSNGYLVQTLGMVQILGLMALSSVLQAYVILLALSAATQLRQGK